MCRRPFMNWPQIAKTAFIGACLAMAIGLVGWAFYQWVGARV